MKNVRAFLLGRFCWWFGLGRTPKPLNHAPSLFMIWRKWRYIDLQHSGQTLVNRLSMIFTVRSPGQCYPSAHDGSWLSSR
jgi:hypothetical protein